ncbi:hypothetical protein ACS5PJ_11100 [Pseudarthrobacter sp. YS3]|uniref:hypothetical protein n=1 Tax=Pseudarthrobacter sp. YS3 TaxID=3453718 RepID=UPI003EE95DE4
MTVTGGSRNRTAEPFERAETPEALIPEARQHARHRRGVYLISALLTLLGALFAAFLVPPLGPQQRRSLNEPPAMPLPVAQNPAAIVAVHGIYHFGWVIVYDDGRVIHRLDLDSGLTERRLTARGTELVRSGDVHPGALIVQPDSLLPAGLWADPQAQPYIAATFAACYEPSANMEARMGYLPAGVQSLLRGRERTYKDVDIFTRAFGDLRPDEECADVSPAEASYVASAVVGDTVPAFKGLTPSGEWCATVGPPLDAAMLCLRPVLPHGSWVLWGG